MGNLCGEVGANERVRDKRKLERAEVKWAAEKEAGEKEDEKRRTREAAGPLQSERDGLRQTMM
jgi:sRNA-binding protein